MSNDIYLRTAGAITAFTFRNLKRKESLGVGKTRCIARFPCKLTLALVLASSKRLQLGYSTLPFVQVKPVYDNCVILWNCRPSACTKLTLRKWLVSCNGHHLAWVDNIMIMLADDVICVTHSDVQGWSSECPDVKNNKWRLDTVWHSMLYSCTRMATVGIMTIGLIRRKTLVCVVAILDWLAESRGSRCGWHVWCGLMDGTICASRWVSARH